MAAKKVPVTKLSWLIQQKNALEASIRLAEEKKQFARVHFKRAKLFLLNQQWRSLATKTLAHNDSQYD